MIGQSCRACGHAVLQLGEGRAMHAAAMRCANCAKFFGWLKQTQAAYLRAFIEQHGRPSAPIQVPPDDAG